MEELTDNFCERCNFDASTWDETSKVEAILRARQRVEAAFAEIDPSAISTRPSPTTWSPLEYVEHIREVLAHNRLVCEAALIADGQPYGGPFPPPFGEPSADLDQASVLAALHEEALRNAELFASLGGGEWQRYGVLLDSKWTMRFALTHMVHELLHHIDDMSAASST